MLDGSLSDSRSMTASSPSVSAALGDCAAAGALNTALAMMDDKNRASPVMPERVMGMPLSGCGGSHYTRRRRRRHRGVEARQPARGCIAGSRTGPRTNRVPIGVDLRLDLRFIHHHNTG